MPTNTPAQPALPSGAPAGVWKALLVLGGLTVGLLIGYGAGRVSTGTPINPLSEKRGGYEEGYEAAKQKIAALGLLPPVQTESSSLMGIVKTVAEGSLTIETDVNLDPLEINSFPKTRTVTIVSSTVLVRLSELTSAERAEAESAFAKASAEYQPDPERPTLPPTPPSPFKEAKISLNELKVGDRVNVDAATDVLSAISFEAVKITLLPAPTTEAPPAPPIEPAVAP